MQVKQKKNYIFAYCADWHVDNTEVTIID